jgi:hypothetical protein
MHFLIFWCKFLRVKSEKLAKTLSYIYTAWRSGRTLAVEHHIHAFLEGAQTCNCAVTGIIITGYRPMNKENQLLLLTNEPVEFEK